MYRLIRFYNKNRKKILIIILIIAFFFLVLRVLDHLEKNKADKTLEVLQTTNTYEQNTTSNSVISNKSLVSGGILDTKVIQKKSKIIDEFINNCKQHNIENAYNLISKSCKEQLFKTKDIFEEKYLDLIFDKKDIIYTIENWYDNTYKINITENILSTGKKSNYSKQDYITVIEEDGVQKLNINSFIGETKINREEEIKKVKIKVENEIQYMDYIIFTLEFNNSNDTDILLDNLENINDIYILDENNAKYYLYTHEISDKQLLIPSHTTKKINLKFYSKNILSKTINRIAFKNVILNYGISGYEEKTEYIVQIRN